VSPGPAVPASLPAPEQVRADFDRIATLADPDAEHTARYHSFLLAQVPGECGHALEVGCGTGAFARALAARAGHVTAIDFSPVMVRLARERSAGIRNLEIVEADLLGWPLRPRHYDFIASIATLHHVPAAPTLAAWARALRPGGVLAVLDVRSARGPVDRAQTLIAYALSRLLRVLRTGRLRAPAQVRAAWSEHGRREHYLTIAEARVLGAECLPVVRRHLLWRYSLVWTRPFGREDA